MNSNGNWRVFVTDGAAKQIRRLPLRYRERIERIIGEMEADPFGGDIVKLGGEQDEWRRRVGAYRILFKVLSREKTVFIREVKRRTSSTY